MTGWLGLAIKAGEPRRPGGADAAEGSKSWAGHPCHFRGHRQLTVTLEPGELPLMDQHELQFFT